jgi:hypothetical protein
MCHTSEQIMNKSQRTFIELRMGAQLPGDERFLLDTQHGDDGSQVMMVGGTWWWRYKWWACSRQ